MPALPPGLTYVEVAAGTYHTVARLSDGSVVAWGSNVDGECNVPALPPGLTYVGVAAGAELHVGAAERRLGRRCGAQRPNGQCNVPAVPGGSRTRRSRREGFLVGRYGIAAGVVSAGTGCGGAGMPTLVQRTAHRPDTSGSSLTQATPGASGFLYFSTVPAAPIVLGSGCTVELDLATFAAFTPVRGPRRLLVDSPSASLRSVGLVGLQLALQIALFGVYGGPDRRHLNYSLIALVGY